MKLYRFRFKDGTETLIRAINSLYAVAFVARKFDINLLAFTCHIETMERVEE